MCRSAFGGGGTFLCGCRLRGWAVRRVRGGAACSVNVGVGCIAELLTLGEHAVRPRLISMRSVDQGAVRAVAGDVCGSDSMCGPGLLRQVSVPVQCARV